MYRYDTSERYRGMSSGRKSDIAMGVETPCTRARCAAAAVLVMQLDAIHDGYEMRRIGVDEEQGIQAVLPRGGKTTTSAMAGSPAVHGLAAVAIGGGAGGSGRSGNVPGTVAG